MASEQETRRKLKEKVQNLRREKKELREAREQKESRFARKEIRGSISRIAESIRGISGVGRRKVGQPRQRQQQPKKEKKQDKVLDKEKEKVPEEKKLSQSERERVKEITGVSASDLMLPGSEIVDLPESKQAKIADAEEKLRKVAPELAEEVSKTETKREQISEVKTRIGGTLEAIAGAKAEIRQEKKQGDTQQVKQERQSIKRLRENLSSEIQMFKKRGVSEAVIQKALPKAEEFAQEQLEEELTPEPKRVKREPKRKKRKISRIVQISGPKTDTKQVVLGPGGKKIGVVPESKEAEVSRLLEARQERKQFVERFESEKRKQSISPEARLRAAAKKGISPLPGTTLKEIKELPKIGKSPKQRIKDIALSSLKKGEKGITRLEEFRNQSIPKEEQREILTQRRVQRAKQKIGDLGIPGVVGEKIEASREQLAKFGIQTLSRSREQVRKLASEGPSFRKPPETPVLRQISAAGQFLVEKPIKGIGAGAAAPLFGVGALGVSRPVATASRIGTVALRQFTQLSKGETPGAVKSLGRFGKAAGPVGFFGGILAEEFAQGALLNRIPLRGRLVAEIPQETGENIRRFAPGIETTDDFPITRAKGRFLGRTPDITEAELRNIPFGRGAAPFTQPAETRIISESLQQLPEEATTRLGREAPERIRNILQEGRGVREAAEKTLAEQTEFLTPEETQKAFQVIGEETEQAAVKGSVTFADEVREGLPGDIDVVDLTEPEARQLQTKLAQEIEALEPSPEKPLALEARGGKAIELLPEGQDVVEGERAPEFVFGFRKELPRVEAEEGVPATQLGEELTGKAQGLGRLGLTEEQELTIRPGEGRVKDIPDFLGLARLAEERKFASRRLSENIQALEELFPGEKQAVDEPVEVRVSPGGRPSPTPSPEVSPGTAFTSSVISPAPSPRPSPEPSPAPSVSPFITSNVSPAPSPRVSPRLSPTPSPTPSPVVSPLPSPTPSPAPSPPPSPSPGISPLPSPSPTFSPGPSPTPSPSLGTPPSPGPGTPPSPSLSLGGSTSPSAGPGTPPPPPSPFTRTTDVEPEQQPRTPRETPEPPEPPEPGFQPSLAALELDITQKQKPEFTTAVGFRPVPKNLNNKNPFDTLEEVIGI